MIYNAAGVCFLVAAFVSLAVGEPAAWWACFAIANTWLAAGRLADLRSEQR